MSLLNFLFGQSSAATDPGMLGLGRPAPQPAPPATQQDTARQIGDLVQNPEVQQAVSQVAQDPNHPLHKGLFGQHGILRDLMGTVGDSVLQQNGMAAEYQPRREREQLGDAYQGFATDPIGAIGRVAQRDPKMAQEMYKQYQANELDTRKAAPQIRKDTFTVDDKVRDNAAGLMHTANNDAEWTALRNRALAYAKSNGVDLSADIPEKRDPAWAMSAVPVKDQLVVNETGRHNLATEGTSARNAATAERNVNVNAALGGGRLIVQGLGEQVKAALGGANAQTSAAKGVTSAAGNTRQAAKAIPDIVRVPPALANAPINTPVTNGKNTYVIVGGGYMKLLKGAH